MAAVVRKGAPQGSAQLWRWLLLALLLALLAEPQRVQAHPKIVEVVPADGSQLDAAPPLVRIAFNEPLEAGFSRIEVFDAERRSVAPAGGRSPNEPTALELALPPLGPGVYTVVWQTVGSDGHQVKGNFAFSISETAAPAATAPTGSGTAPALQPTRVPAVATPQAPATPIVDLELVTMAATLRALMLLGALGAPGALLASALVLAPSLPQGSAVASLAGRRARALALLCLLLLLVATLLMLVYYSNLLAGAVSPDIMLSVLGTTRYGQALLARLLLGLALLALLLPRAAPVGSRAVAALALGAALLLSFSLAGHAAAEAIPLLPILGDWLHLAASALWVGGLLLLGLTLPAVARALAPEQRAAALGGVVARFSPLALLSVATLGVSGIYAALLQLNALSDLWTSAYGLALLAKLLLFGCLIALGAHNLLLAGPRLRAEATQADPALLARWQGRFFSALRGEVLLALVIFLAAGALTSLAPPDAQTPTYVPPTSTEPSASAISATTAPATPTRTPVPSRPFAQEQPAGDLRVRFEVSPASIFKNDFTVLVADQQGKPRDVQLVRMTFTMIEMDMGIRQVEMTPAGNGRYTAEGSPLSMVGDWKVEVLVRREDAPDATATFTVPVGE